MSLLFTIGWLIMGSLAAYFAKQRGRNPYIWFFIGLLFGILGLILIFMMPNKKENIIQAKPTSEPLPQPDLKKPFAFWYYVDENQCQQGPMSEQAFEQAKQEGKILPLSYVWNTHMENWKHLQDC